MSCDNAQELISLLIDHKIVAGEREKVLAHLESCKECGSQFESMQKTRATLRTMDRVPVPLALDTKLRVIASREHARRVRVASGQYLSDRVRLWFDNLMRPVFMPLAGGVLSAAMIFCVLVPTLSFQPVMATDTFGQPLPAMEHRPVWGQVVVSSGSASSIGAGADMPTIEPAYTESSDDATVVWLAIGENGKVQDYKLAKGQLTPDMINIISTSKFGPMTVLGVPTSGLVKMVQRRVPGRHVVRS